MLNHRLPLALITASLFCPLLAAQPPSIQPAQSTPAAGQVTPARPTKQRVPDGTIVLSVDFGGGTLGQFVDAVKQACPEPINVVVPADAMMLTVPALSLKNVSPYMALRSLEFVNGYVSWSPAPGMGGVASGSEIQITDLNMNDRYGPTGSLTFAVMYMKRNPNIGMPVSKFEQQTQVFSVREMLAGDPKNGEAGLTLDQIVQPIETALEVDASDNDAKIEPPKLMVHKESNLIIVRGTSRQTGLARQVLDKLRQDIDQTRAAQLPDRERIKLIKERRDQYEIQMGGFSKQLVEVQRQLREMGDKPAAGEKNDPAAVAQRTKLEEWVVANERMLAETKMKFDQVEFEVAREMRSSSPTINVYGQIVDLRNQVESLRKQLEESKAPRQENPR